MQDFLRNINWRMEDFSYVIQKDYKSDPKVTSGQMKNICEHYGAKKWPADSLGLCCLEGKINLPKIKDSSRIAQEFIMQNTLTAKHFK